MRGAADLRRELSVRGQQIAFTNASVHELTARRDAQRHLRTQRKQPAR